MFTTYTTPALIVLAFNLLWISALHAAAAPVGVATVLQEQVAEEVTLVGSAIPRRSSQVSAQVEGMVTAMRVDRGDVVSQGDELFRLDDTLAQYELERAEAQLAQAQAESEDAERKLSEAQRLRTEGHIPQSTLDTATTTAAVAAARRDERQAEVGRSKRLVAQHRVTAPFSGTVVAKDAEVGQWIRRDSAVVRLDETHPARIEVPVPENVYAQLGDSASVKVRFDSLPGQDFVGQVGARVPQGSAGARTFPVWFDIDNQAGRIAPGMSARITLGVGRGTRSALFVPSDALVRRSDGSTLVWLVREDASVDGDRVAKAVQVEVGGVNGDRTQVRGSGIAVGDLVVVRGNENLRPNQPVRVVTSAAGGS